PDTWAFLSQLEADNTKVWFDRNRARYDAHVATPCKALVSDLAEVLPDRLHPDLRIEPTVGRSLFRINRDTRFAADKTPYKTHLDFLFWVGDGPPRASPAFIMRLTAQSVLIGGGQMGLRGPALDAYRAAVADTGRGAALRRTVDGLLAAGADLSEPDRKRVPAPYPADHPNADLLRRDGFHLTQTHPHPPSLQTPAYLGWCATALEPFAPVVSWLAEAPT
ncbi:MAG TPA: DUF2461 domain-containing protein, partial [Euzebya sp.]|nr:DUF2461 domain-containing protein [Euzebya sp.]